LLGVANTIYRFLTTMIWKYCQQTSERLEEDHTQTPTIVQVRWVVGHLGRFGFPLSETFSKSTQTMKLKTKSSSVFEGEKW